MAKINLAKGMCKLLINSGIKASVKYKFGSQIYGCFKSLYNSILDSNYEICFM